jgi:hypothetical protein
LVRFPLKIPGCDEELRKKEEDQTRRRENGRKRRRREKGTVAPLHNRKETGRKGENKG